jgi:hypothetical protein
MTAFMIQQQARADDSGAIRTWTFATHHMDGLPADVMGGIEDPGYFERHAFGRGQVIGAPQTGGGLAALINAEHQLDAMLLQGIEGERLQVFTGPADAASVNDLRLLLTGTTARVGHENGQILLDLRNRQAEVAGLTLQSDRYLGNNVGPEGVEGTEDDLAGAYKPVTVGFAENVTAPNVNPQRHIHQISTNSEIPIVGTEPIDIFDKATRFEVDYTEETDWATFEGETGPSDEIWWYFGPQGWFIRLPGRAAGTVTVTVQEGTEANCTTAQLARRILQAKGIPPSSILGVEAMDAEFPEPIGFHAGVSEIKVGAALAEILQGVFGTWTDDALGFFTLAWLAPPSPVPDHEFVELLAEGDSEGFRIVDEGEDSGAQPGSPTPLKEAVALFRRNWTIQGDTDVATGVPNTEHGNFVAREYRQQVADNSAVLAKYPFAQAFEFKTLFKTADAALRAAKRAVALFGRRRFIVEIDLDPSVAAKVLMFQTIRLPIGRFDWGIRTFRIIGFIQDLDTKDEPARTTLVLWG